MKFEAKQTVFRALSLVCLVSVAFAGGRPARAEGFDRARANAVWDRLLTQESTLGRLQSAPKNWDDTVGIPGKVFQAPSRLLHWANSSWGRSATIRESFVNELSKVSGELTSLHADIKATGAQGQDALQARLGDFERSLDGTGAELRDAEHLWSQYTDEHVESGETVVTGLTYVRDGAVIFDVAAGTVLTGGALVGVGVTAASPVAVGVGGTATVHGLLFKGMSGDDKAKGDSTGNPGGGEVEVDLTPVDPTPAKPAQPDPAPPLPNNAAGNWVLKDPDAAHPNWVMADGPHPDAPAPVAPPVQKPKPKPTTAPAPAPVKPKPVTPLAAPGPITGNGNIFTAPGPHATGPVGGISNSDKDNEIKCDADSIKQYDTNRRLPNDLLHIRDKILGVQQSYFCRVNALYADDPQAIFLSRLGLRAANVGEALGNPFTACEKIRDEMKANLADVKALRKLDKSPEFKKLEDDFKALMLKDCGDLIAMGLADHDPMVEGLSDDLCQWKKVMEDKTQGGRPGAGAGFSGLLAACKRL